MKTILSHVHRLGQRYAQRAFFDFLRDAAVSPLHRLAFLPAIAPYVIGLDDLYRHVLRSEPAADGLQRMVNDHVRAAQQAAAVAAYRADLARLGRALPIACGPAPEERGDEATTASRVLALRLAHLGWAAGPAQRLALITCIEAADDALFDLTQPLATAHRRRGGEDLHFCAGNHRPDSVGEARGWSREQLATLVLGDEDRDKALAVVDDAFCVFNLWSHALWRHAGLQAALLGLRSTGATPAGAGIDIASPVPSTAGARH